MNNTKNLEYVKCNLCGEKDETPLFEKSTPTGEKLLIVRCKKCGLAYVNPRLKEKEIHKLHNMPEYFKNLEGVVSGYTDYIVFHHLIVQYLCQGCIGLYRLYSRLCRLYKG